MYGVPIRLDANRAAYKTAIGILEIVGSEKQGADQLRGSAAWIVSSLVFAYAKQQAFSPRGFFSHVQLVTVNMGTCNSL